MADDQQPVGERRAMPFQTERAKFEMQIRVTFYLFMITTALMAAVVYKGDLPAVEKLLDKMMTFFGMVVTYWIGASKGAADAREQLARMLPQAPPPARTGSSTSTTTTEVKS